MANLSFSSRLSHVLDSHRDLTSATLLLQAEVQTFRTHMLGNQSLLLRSRSARKRRSRPKRAPHARRYQRTFGDWSGEWLQDGEGSLGVPGEPPKLLLLYHMEKCGGTSVKQWLSRNVRPPVTSLPRRLDAVVDYALARCFLCAQWGEGSSTPLLHRPPLRACRRCPTVSRWRLLPASLVADGAWERARVAVEFHANSKALFWSHIVPRLSALRTLYAARNGTVVTATVLRHPVAHLFSAFYMWPPAVERADHQPEGRPGGRRKANQKARRALAMPFPRWIETAAGAQAGLLSARFFLVRNESRDVVDESTWLPTVFGPPSRGMHNPAGCAAVQDRSLCNIAEHFDVLGVTDCLATFLDDLETRLALQPPDSPLQRARRRKGPNGRPNATLQVRPTSGTASDPALAEEVHAWAWPTLNATVRAKLIAVAACDLRLYEAARRRIAGVPVEAMVEAGTLGVTVSAEEATAAVATGAVAVATEAVATVGAASPSSITRASCPEHSMDDLVFVRGKSHPRRKPRRRTRTGTRRNGTSGAAGSSGKIRGKGKGRGRGRAKRSGIWAGRRRKPRTIHDEDDG